MPHESPLIATIAVGLAFAFRWTLIAVRLRLPPLVGHLLAGIAVDPSRLDSSPTSFAPQLAEIGVILLMFGVGMHFSVRDLLGRARHCAARRSCADHGSDGAGSPSP
jgi:CPA2 family monovalent cation:H+ antiporter-2